jgi:hypothetical protein
MTDVFPDKLYVYQWGEAYDDLRTAFYIDERRYPSAEAAQAARRGANAAMKDFIGGVEVTSGKNRIAPGAGVPTWEEFRQRHFVDGVPTPVRPSAGQVAPPPGWNAMNEELSRARQRLREELLTVLAEAFPGGTPFVDSDRPSRRESPASIDLSDERYGFGVRVGVETDGPPPVSTAAAVTALRRHGWQAEPSTPAHTGLSTRTHRDDYTVVVLAEAGTVFLAGRSPLFRAPAEPGSTWVTEPRPQPDLG